MFHRANLIDDLIKHEGTNKRGIRHYPYVDTVGKVTIGYGRNLTDIGISDDEAQSFLEHDVLSAETACYGLIDNFTTIDRTRQDAIINMMFNLGRTRLSKFKRFLTAIEAQDWPLAATEMLKSRWATQVGGRATYLSYMIRHGKRPA